MKGRCSWFQMNVTLSDLNYFIMISHGSNHVLLAVLTYINNVQPPWRIWLVNRLWGKTVSLTELVLIQMLDLSCQVLVLNILNPLSLSTSHPFYWISFCTEGQQGCNQPYKFQHWALHKERNHKLLAISDLHKLAALYILGHTQWNAKNIRFKTGKSLQISPAFSRHCSNIVIFHETRPHLRSPVFQTLLIAQGKCRLGPALESMTMTAHTISLSHSNLHTWHPTMINAVSFYWFHICQPLMVLCSLLIALSTQIFWRCD